MPFGQYLFRTEFQTTSVVNFLWVIVGMLLIFAVTGGQLLLYYKFENMREFWNTGSIILSVMLFVSFCITGVRLFERLIYNNKFFTNAISP
jgi:hypothetical protein